MTHARLADEARLLDLFRELKADEQQRLLQQIHRAVRDKQLRPSVLELWGPACAACELSLETQEGLYECEIAHIHQVRDQGTDSPSNALPLCRTHHWAFDQHLWGIDPETKKIFVRNEYRENPALLGLHQSSLKPKRHGAESNMDKTALRKRWKLARLS
jgi:putative restriction endonuclease